MIKEETGCVVFVNKCNFMIGVEIMLKTFVGKILILCNLNYLFIFDVRNFIINLIVDLNENLQKSLKKKSN